MHKVFGRTANLSRKARLAIGVVVVAILGLVLAVHTIQPERSVTNYCTVYRQEKVRLSTLSNDQNPYPSGVFDVSVNDADQIATSLGKLDRVAPSGIEPEVKTLQSLYQEIHDDPSKAISASLNGGSIDNSLRSWTSLHCGDN